MRATEVVKAIMEYDSDTFCAADENITKTEALLVAEELFERMWNHIDGVTLGSILDEVRQDREEIKRQDELKRNTKA